MSFLGTYASRNSAYDGYWLFGFIVGRVSRLDIDLLSPDEIDEPAPIAATRAVARRRFREQLAKNKVAESVRSATLLIEVAPPDVPPRPHWRNASPVRFTVTATSRWGKVVTYSAVTHAAAHDPNQECRCIHD